MVWFVLMHVSCMVYLPCGLSCDCAELKTNPCKSPLCLQKCIIISVGRLLICIFLRISETDRSCRTFLHITVLSRDVDKVPRPRPVSSTQTNNFSVKHKKSYAKVIQTRQNIICIYISFWNFSLQFLTFRKHQHWPRPRTNKAKTNKAKD